MEKLTEQQILSNIKKLSAELKNEISSLEKSGIVTSVEYNRRTNKDVLVFAIDCTQGIER